MHDVLVKPCKQVNFQDDQLLNPNGSTIGNAL